MALQGDVAQIPLSNILQALLLNGQEGVLKLEGANLRRRIRVLKAGLRPLNFEANGSDLLRTVLLKQRILTDGQFANIISTWVPGSTCAGDFLVSRRILTAEVVKNEVRYHLENLLLEVLLTTELKYEFAAEEDAAPYEIFSPDGLGEELIYSANGLLMEAMHRDDDWRRFREQVPSPSEIFVPTDRAGLSAKNLDVPPRVLKELRPFLNGENSVAQIIAATSLTSFDVHQAIFALKARGLLRPLDTAGKKNLAEKLRRSLRSADAAEIYRSILLTEPDDSATRLKLISLLEKTKDGGAETIEHLLVLGAATRKTDPKKAEEYLGKVLEASPSNLHALSLVFEIHRAAGDHREALGVARSVLAAARSGKDGSAAVDLVYKIVNFYPQEAVLFHELSEVHLAQGNIDAAVDCLKTVAEVYEGRADYTRLRKTYEMIARLRPGEAGKLRRVQELERRRRRPGRNVLRSAALHVIATLVLTPLALFAVSEYFARVTYAEIARDVEIQKRFRKPERARRSLEEYIRAFPGSLRAGAAQDVLGEIESLRRRMDDDARISMEKRLQAAQSALSRAHIAVNGNDFVKALEILDRLDMEPLVGVQLEEAKKLQWTLRRYFQESDDLAKAADAAEKSGGFPDAYRLRMEILAKYPYSRAAAAAALPVRVETAPPGADVVIDGKILGQTPLVIKIPPVTMPLIHLQKQGYEAVCLNREKFEGSYFSPLAGQVALVALPKTVEWMIEGGGSIEAAPLPLGTEVCLATRNGDVQCRKADGGELVWSWSTPGKMDVAGGLGTWKDRIYFGCFDGNLYVLDAMNGSLAVPPIIASPGLLPIKWEPSPASESGVIVANCDRKLLAAFHLTTGQHAWSLPFPGPAVLGQPQAFGGNIYVPTTAGEILEIGHDTGVVGRRLSLGAELAVPGRIAGDRYYLGTAGGKLLAVDLADLSVAWSRDCRAQPVSTPIADGKSVIVSAAGGKLLCFAADGEPRWSLDTRDVFHAEGEGVIFGNSLFLGTRGGHILCIDVSTGRPVWRFETKGAALKDPKGVIARGTIGDGRLFVGAEDGRLYCFSVE